MIDMVPQTEEEMEGIRNAVISQQGLLLSVFDVLRRVPRRVLMVLKLNDLTRCVRQFIVAIQRTEVLCRSLDHALMTTHSNVSLTTKSAIFADFA